MNHITRIDTADMLDRLAAATASITAHHLPLLRAVRERNRRLRREALRLFAAVAAADDTISGATLILPNGGSEYIDADLLRRGGRA